MMKALSIRQPWPWLIIRPDLKTKSERLAAAARGLIKDVENRTWPTKYRGPVLIHAGKQLDPWISDDDLRLEFGIKAPNFYDKGGFVGVVDIVGCVTHSTSRWFSNAGYAFLLENARPVKFRAWPGSLGLFDVPDHVANQLVERHYG